VAWQALEFTLSEDNMERLNLVAEFDVGFPQDFIGSSYETNPWVKYKVAK
jgi:hypothetical protein